MAQHDYNIGDQNGFDFLVDLNNALSAIATNNAGSSEPNTTFAHMLWFDTNNDLMKVRNEANSAWVVVAKKDGSGWTPYRQGTALGTASILDTGTGPDQVPKNSQLATGALRPDTFARGIGEPFPVLDHLAGATIPSNAGTQKFIKLTAGLLGVGNYNEGLLTNETVTGSAPRIVATAEIVSGPMAGEVVSMINTEGSFLRPGTSSGALQFDQMRKHSHRFNTEGSGDAGSREIIRSQNQSIDAANIIGDPKYVSDGFQDFSSVAGGTDQTQFMGGEVRPKSRQATHYMRIV